MSRLKPGQSAGRVGDLFSNSDGLARGRAASGSMHVAINGAPAPRVGDSAADGSADDWTVASGARFVLINGKNLYRMGDAVELGGKTGLLAQGSANVFVGGPAAVTEKKSLPEPSFLDLAVAWIDIDGIPGMIKSFGKGAKYGLSRVLGEGLMTLGIAGGVKAFKGVLAALFKTTGAWIGVAFEYLVLAAAMVPDFHSWARWFFHNYVDRLLHGWHAAAIDECPSRRPATSSPDAAGDYLVMKKDDPTWESIPDGCDVSLAVARLLEAYKPVFVEDPDDLRAISMANLLSYATLDPLPAGETCSPTSLEEYARYLNKYKYMKQETPHKKSQKDIEDEQREQARRAPCTGGPFVAAAGMDTTLVADPDPWKGQGNASLVIQSDYARGREKNRRSRPHVSRSSDQAWKRYHRTAIFCDSIRQLPSQQRRRSGLLRAWWRRRGMLGHAAPNEQDVSVETVGCPVRREA